MTYGVLRFSCRGLCSRRDRRFAPQLVRRSAATARGHARADSLDARATALDPRRHRSRSAFTVRTGEWIGPLRRCSRSRTIHAPGGLPARNRDVEPRPGVSEHRRPFDARWTRAARRPTPAWSQRSAGCSAVRGRLAASSRAHRAGARHRLRLRRVEPRDRQKLTAACASPVSIFRRCSKHFAARAEASSVCRIGSDTMPGDMHDITIPRSSISS